VSRALALIIGGLVIAALIVGFLLLEQCSATRSSKTRADIATGQAGATMISGNDAVNVVGGRAEADAAGDKLTRENEDAIRQAEGADAPVAAPVRDAGHASLCGRDAYRGKPECVQHAGPR
jgi:hypothetical protein